MTKFFTVRQVEEAINVWRTKEPKNVIHTSATAEILVLGKKTRILADVYGAMICSKSESIGAADLTPTQTEALAEVGIVAAEAV